MKKKLSKNLQKNCYYIVSCDDKLFSPFKCNFRKCFLKTKTK